MLVLLLLSPSPSPDVLFVTFVVAAAAAAVVAVVVAVGDLAVVTAALATASWQIKLLYRKNKLSRLGSFLIISNLREFVENHIILRLLRMEERV